MSARRPKLPPLVRYQVDLYDPATGLWMMQECCYWKLRSARADWRDEDYETGTLLAIRRLSDGAIVWCNKAAREAGL